MMKSGCTTEKNTGLVYDPRFKPSGLFTDVLSVQSASEVVDLIELRPDYSYYGD